MFACFLKLNAVKPFNDAMEEYIRVFIRSRGNRQSAICYNLEIVLQQYKIECNIISEALKASTSDIPNLNTSEIGKLIDGLYSLKNAGPMLKQLEYNSDNAENVNETSRLTQTIELSNLVTDVVNRSPLYNVLKERKGG